jgi:transcriptional regulator with XRE-family HTH domain
VGFPAIRSSRTPRSAEGLRFERERRGLTQHELAKRSGIAQPVIAMIERLRTPNPTWSTVSRLSRALRVSPWKLFGEPARGSRQEAQP